MREIVASICTHAQPSQEGNTVVIAPSPPPHTPLHLLLIEDDEIDVELIQRTLRGAAVTLTVARNGLEALALLRETGAAQQPYFPGLILLDLNMPLMNGLAFLRALRADPRLRRCIVFVLSSSDLDSDKLAAYNYHVAG